MISVISRKNLFPLYYYEERDDSFVFGMIVTGEFKYLGTHLSVGEKLWIPLSYVSLLPLIEAYVLTIQLVA